MNADSPRDRRNYLLFAAVVLVMLSGAVGYRIGIFSARHISVVAVRRPDDAVRARLLTEAMDYVGVCTPEAAADTWVQGLMMRSAAMQYAVMDTDLRESYAQALTETAPNWVTGVSSPWINAYEITAQNQTAPDTAELTLRIDTQTSTGPMPPMTATLTIVQRGDFWRITAIRGDEGLQAYTGMPVSP